MRNLICLFHYLFANIMKRSNLFLEIYGIDLKSQFFFRVWIVRVLTQKRDRDSELFDYVLFMFNIYETCCLLGNYLKGQSLKPIVDRNEELLVENAFWTSFLDLFGFKSKRLQNYSDVYVDFGF